MSGLRKISDAERTATMLDLIRRRYEGGGMSQSHVVIEEVAPGTGFSGVARWADVLVLSVWPSNGLTLDGYEIKASKQDLKKELRDPSKHQAVARYCDTWSLLAWDESILVDGIPESWGIQITVDGKNGRELKEYRKAPKRSPEPWSRGFVCSLVRNAAQQSPGAAYVARAILNAQDIMWRQRTNAINGAIESAVAPLATALYGPDRWKWPRGAATDPAALVKAAAERLTQGALALDGAP